MILQVVIFFIIVFVLNFLLYLSININENISYLILNLIIFLNFISFHLHKNSKNTNQPQVKKENTAEDHPIIKAARERLKK